MKGYIDLQFSELEQWNETQRKIIRAFSGNDKIINTDAVIKIAILLENTPIAGLRGVMGRINFEKVGNYDVPTNITIFLDDDIKPCFDKEAFYRNKIEKHEQTIKQLKEELKTISGLLTRREPFNSREEE